MFVGGSSLFGAVARLAAGAFLVLLGGGGPPPAQAAPPPVELLPHRAAYRLKLADVGGAGRLTGVQGGLVLEWRAACDGWLSQQRLGFVAQAEEGQGFTYDVRFSSWEAKDNTQLRFNVRSFDGKELHEEFRGLARLDGPGGKGAASYAIPEGERVDLPPGTIFPTEHVVELIEAAQAGERFVTRQVFDGSGEDALTRATAVIGAARTATLPDGGGTETRWPVSLAYFPLGGDDALPQFEIAFELSQGGVLRDVTLDYGDFRLQAELEKLEALAAPVCD
jgi:hypothetical protein